jgi:hypothetical protein
VKAPFIRGKSTSNTPIERHWKTIGERFTQKYARTFAQLEEQHDLDVDEPVDIFCLHYCFLPLINRTISTHIVAHNSHGSTTKGERGWSPYKKWLDGNLKAQARGMDLDLFPNDAVIDDEGVIDECLSGDEEDVEPGRHTTKVTTWPSEQQREDQNRPAQDTDPYVQVERYHEMLPPLLQDEGFRKALAEAFPIQTSHELDEGEDGLFDTLRYLAVRQWVYDSVRSNPGFALPSTP